jgi:hypothetical protein
MASFTDQIVAFNPYVSQIPVDDYVRVGMQKQLEYNQGVEKVQGYIDSVAGLEVIMPEQKDYLHQRVNNLQQEVGRVVQADFSKQQLVNSVGSLTSKIASDPIIQTAVASTQTYKQGIAAMKEAKEKGKSSISNEWDFNDQFQKWYNSKDITARFSGSFTPYTDVTGKVSKIIKDLEPNSQIEDNPFKRGNHGEILMDRDGLPQIDWAMIEKGSKSLTPERIKAAISANMTSDDLNQLTIDGRYSYRGQDATGMKSITDQSYQYKLDQVNDIIQGLMVQKATANNNPQLSAQIDSQIQAYKDKASYYQNSYGQDMAMINNNLEAYKGQLYSSSWLNKFGDGYAYSQNSLTYKENPYFMAAERRRENDIKFNEFKAKHELDLMQYGLEVERLGIEKDKLEAYKESLRIKASGKKTAQGALEGIGLSDAILEPIVQKELEDVNVTSFLKDTDVISNDIDTQKMAILAQNTGFVILKKDKDGKNPHYEYNVPEGKNGDIIKSAAESAMGRLKEAYDKDPNSVDDGTRTYFRNLSNADQVVQNRKFAIGKVQEEAEKEHSIKPLMAKLSPIKLGNVTLNPQDQVEFLNKLKQVEKQEYSNGQYTTTYDDNTANSLFKTSQERAAYQIIKNGRNTPEVSNFIDKLRTVEGTVIAPARTTFKQRDVYMNNAVRSLVGTQQPVSFTLEAFEAADRNRAKAVASRLVNTIISDDKESPNPRYDKKKILEMLGDDAGNTSYSLVSKGRGRYALGLSNTKVTGDPIEMDLTRPQAEELFGQNKFLDDFYNIRQSLQLTKNTGKWTTDVRGLGRESAFNLENGLTNKYSVKYHVEEPLKNGGLQVRMYIYDRTNGTWLPEKTAGFGQLLNEAQVTKFLSTVGDQYIDATLLPNK